MKIRGFLLAGFFLTAVLAASVQADVLSKVRADGTDYCHMKFPAIEELTLFSDQPVLKSADTSDIIDFHGPCDHDPLGKVEIAVQRLQATTAGDGGNDGSE
ncbi:MAG: hypothetical protein A2038_14260 [Deltaproteobacteria bacterium GWA2_57_13]|nr:MAG: hypothetical protein A2038_14260 [Deltaproteobacteria bacterium GWA2_57_13]OGQ50261.1 MAG: hypothetical protein A3I10_02505 [Deltaproteobacteria bacterium RIFCSPLOWO2_02_FULL_57_26]